MMFWKIVVCFHLWSFSFCGQESGSFKTRCRWKSYWINYVYDSWFKLIKSRRVSAMFPCRHVVNLWNNTVMTDCCRLTWKSASPWFHRQKAQMRFLKRFEPMTLKRKSVHSNGSISCIFFFLVRTDKRLFTLSAAEIQSKRALNVN